MSGHRMNSRISEVSRAHNLQWALLNLRELSLHLVSPDRMSTTFHVVRPLQCQLQEMERMASRTMFSAWRTSYGRCHLSQINHLNRHSRERNSRLVPRHHTPKRATNLQIILNLRNHSFLSSEIGSRPTNLATRDSIALIRQRLMRPIRPKTLLRRRVVQVLSSLVGVSCQATPREGSVLRVLAALHAGSLAWAVKRVVKSTFTANQRAT